MNIVICIKPVKTQLVYPNEERKNNLSINPYDLYTLQECIKLKNKYNLHIICLSMGTHNSAEILKRCIAMGADDAALISDSAFAGSDTVSTTYILSSVIQKHYGDSIVLCGASSVDGETGQVVYGLASRLNLPCITNMVKIISIGDGGAIVEYQDGCIIKKVHIQGNFVGAYDNFTTKEGIVSLLRLKRVSKLQIPIYNNANLSLDKKRCGLDGSKTKVVKVEQDTFSKECISIEGDADEKAKKILSIIR